MTKENLAADQNREEFGASGMMFTRIGLGTWAMEQNPESSGKALRAGIEAGSNHIDTAEMYGSGEAEEIVGKAVRGMRDKVRIVSKVLPSNAGYEKTLSACERSLKRLGTDYIDVYLLHWRQKQTPLEETFRAFRKLKKDGKIRAWGVSNFGVADMEEAVRLAGDGEIACNQVLYYLEERAIEFDLIPWCRKRRVAVTAYSPFGHGGPIKSPILESIAKEHGATSAQIILAFLARDPNVFVIPKSSDAERARENARSMDVKLTEKDIRALDRAFPAVRRNDLPTL